MHENTHKNNKSGHFHSFFDHFLPIRDPQNNTEKINPPTTLAPPPHQ